MLLVGCKASKEQQVPPSKLDLVGLRKTSNKQLELGGLVGLGPSVWVSSLV